MLFDIIWVIAVIAVILFLFLCLCRKSSCFTTVRDVPDDIYGTWLSGIVTSVADGDGFKFRLSGYTVEDPQIIKVRLAGIDAPECASRGMPAQPFSNAAKEHLSDLVLNKEVSLKPIKRDRYGRLLAVCFVEESFESPVNVNLKMVEDGLACIYTGSDAEYDDMLSDLTAAQKNAKYKKLGMWIQRDYRSPMDYKKQKRKYKQIQTV